MGRCEAKNIDKMNYPSALRVLTYDSQWRRQRKMVPTVSSEREFILSLRRKQGLVYLFMVCLIVIVPNWIDLEEQLFCWTSHLSHAFK